VNFEIFLVVMRLNKSFSQALRCVLLSRERGSLVAGTLVALALDLWLAGTVRLAVRLGAPHVNDALPLLTDEGGGRGFEVYDCDN
jgi:hypothetical protein